MNQDRAFAISIGLVDGLITSLMITAYAIVYHYPISSIQSLHIAFGSSFVGAISYFIAEFSKLSQNEFRVSKALKPGIKVPPSVKRNLRERNLRESMYGGSASLIMGVCRRLNTTIQLHNISGFSVLIPWTLVSDARTVRHLYF